MIEFTMIAEIEKFVKSISKNSEPAHAYDHFDRVRKWGIKIAEGEGYNDIESVQTACLMHDIGLIHGKKGHGERGAAMAEKFLKKVGYDKSKIEEICHAIRFHGSNRKGRKTELLDILRDADMMELFGPIGIMRGSASGYLLPISDEMGQGQYRGYTAKDFDKLFDTGQVKWESIVDVLNFEISCYDNLNTDTGRKIADRWVDHSRKFLDEFEEQLREIE